VALSNVVSASNVTVTSPNAQGGPYTLHFASPGTVTAALTPGTAGTIAVSTHHSGRLTVGTVLAPSFDLSQVVNVHLSAAANVNLHLVASYQADAHFPQVSTDFHLGWQFSPTDDLTGAQPDIVFNNVSLDLGSFITSFAGPILTQINQALQPVQPVLDFLTQRVPVISDFEGQTVTLLGLAAQLDPNDFGAANDFVNFVQAVHQLAASVPTNGSNLQINFGNFDLGSLADVRTANLGNVNVPTFSDINPDSQDGYSQNSSAPTATQSFVHRLSNSGGFSFPFLTKPSSLFGLLLGKAVTLVQFDSPVLNFTFDYTQAFPILGPVVATLSGHLSASMQLSAGYDTAGLSELVSDPQHKWTDVFDGFFIDTSKTAVTVSAGLAAGAGIDLLVASGGVEGGLFANVNMTLHDPDNDGKMRWAELVNDITTDPLCLFTVSGKVTARLYAWYQFVTPGAQKTELTLVQGPPLIQFNVSCPDGGGGTSNPTQGTFPVPPPPVRVGFTDPTGDNLALIAPSGSTLSGVQSTLADGKNGDPPAPVAGVNAPAGVSINDLPLGAISFSVSVPQSGGFTTVTVPLPDGENVNTWLKYGHEKAGDTPHWYEFNFDPTTGTGAKLLTQRSGTGANTVVHQKFVLFLKDGQRGDDDLATETPGIIVDPGAPALVTPQTPNQRFVTHLYEDVLHREPEHAGLAFWSGALDRGGLNRFQVALDIETSHEVRVNQVEGLYQSLLGRAADPGGLAGGVQFLEQGGTLQELKAEIFASPEYFLRRGGGTNAGFVTAVYDDLFARLPDPGGALIWTLNLDRGVPRILVAWMILQSPEATAVRVGDLYGEVLHRPADANGMSYFALVLSQGMSDDVALAIMAGSAEYSQE
jgi:hypothetical protein